MKCDNCDADDEYVTESIVTVNDVQNKLKLCDDCWDEISDIN